MNGNDNYWACAGCGDAFISTPPEQGLCTRCVTGPNAFATLAEAAPDPCQACGGPVCVNCGHALMILIPVGLDVPAGAARGEVDGDG